MRYWRLLIGLAVAAGIAYAADRLHTQQISAHPLLPVAFEHRDHTPIACTTCHHNYIDDTGHDSCYSCHKTDPTVAADIEWMFHDFCRDCHISEAHAGNLSGPFRVCEQCHNSSGRMANRGTVIKR